MNVSTNLFKSSIIYFIGQVLSKIISFLLLPLYTNYLDPGAYGYYNVSLSVLSVIVPVLFMEIWTGTLRYAIEQKSDEGKRKVINNAIIIAAFSMIVYTVVYIICAIIMQFDLPAWIYFYSFMWVLQLFVLSVARAYGANTLYATSGVISVLFNVVITVIAVFLTNGNISSLYLGMGVSFLIQVVIINQRFHILKGFKRKDYDNELIRSMVHFSVPLCFNSVMYWLMEGFNMLVITAKLGLISAGIYSAASKISVALNLIISVFGLSWQETIFKIEDRDERSVVYNTGFNLMIKVVSMGVILILPLVAMMFPIIIGEKYAGARNLVPFLLLVIFSNSIVTLLTSCFAAEKYNRGNLIAKIVSSFTNVVIILGTIQMLDIYASAIGLFVGNAIGICIQVVLLRKYIRIHPNCTYIFIFVLLFIPTVYIYINSSILVNAIWLLIMGIFSLIYLKDFLLKSLQLALGLRKKNA